MPYPKCFDDELDFETWVKAADNDESDLPDPRFSFCDYCTPMYQLKMIIERRCQNPEFDTEANMVDIDTQGRLL